MLLTEPPRSQGDLNFVLFGLPVRVHPMFWVLTLLLGLGWGEPMALITWVIAVFLSILVHELGHAVAMRAFGFYPSIVLYGMGGLTSWGPGSFGARNPGPAGRVLISAAGPAAGFALAAALYSVLRVAKYDVVLRFGLPGIVKIELGDIIVSLGIVSLGLTLFVYQLLMISIFWGLINLLPVYPLDGGQIAREFLQSLYPREGLRLSLFISAFTAIFLALIAALQWQSVFSAVFFGYMAFGSLQALAAFGRGPW